MEATLHFTAITPFSYQFPSLSSTSKLSNCHSSSWTGSILAISLSPRNSFTVSFSIFC
ncbi:hypothetical protein BVRB_2g042460 [Beta vulgaris subsp. vulgaris]|nr:hypothetical protein BVRB_2g042460 [Beta vulgaris subsp. vulgaris]